MTDAASSPIRRFRIALALFIAGLVISGLTAFPLLWEIELLAGILGANRDAGADPGSLAGWVRTVRDGLADTYEAYPWIAYGTDWLAFAHLVIALFFLQPLLEPRSSRGNLIAGMVACVGVIPLAFIAGGVRGIPVGWRLIDSSFGVVGLALLLYCWRLLPQVEATPKSARSMRRTDLR